jgi:hypothetical protein
MNQIPYKKINLLEIQEKNKIKDYKNKSRNNKKSLFNSNSSGIPQNNFRRKIFIEGENPSLVNLMISTHLSLNKSQMSEFFYKNVYSKFTVDSRIKYAENRNSLFTKSLSKTKNALRRFEKMKDM